MSWQTVTILLLPLQFGYLLSISCLITVAHTMLNKSGESEHFCLLPVLWGNAFIFSPLSMILPVIYGLYFWGMFSLCPLCWEFYHKWMLNFMKSFFFVYRDNHMIFIQFVNDWLVDIEPSLHHWDKSHNHGVWSFQCII